MTQNLKYMKEKIDKCVYKRIKKKYCKQYQKTNNNLEETLYLISEQRANPSNIQRTSKNYHE